MADDPQSSADVDEALLPGLADAPVTSLAPAPSASAAYRVLARKYRPKGFEELIGQDTMVRILTNSFALGRIHQAYMLTGVRGVGKTTTARILARALNYETPARNGLPAIDKPTIAMPDFGVHCAAIIASRHVDVIEMDAASNTGVDDVREIIEGARYKPAIARMKVYIIDEVHMLSKAAFNALLKTLEEPPEHVKFIFATTEIEKVPVTVRSRCLRFDLRRIEPDVMIDHLAGICRAEQVAIDTEALGMVARAAEGSVRDALSLLDQAIAQGGGVATSADQVRMMLGLADKGRIIDLFEALMCGQIKTALDLLGQQYNDGADPAQVLLELAEFTHLVMRFRIVPDAPSRTATREERARAMDFSQRLGLPVLDRAWQILGKGIEEVRQSPRALAAADMALVRLAHLADLPTPDDALRRLGFGSAPKADSQPAAQPANALAQEAIAPSEEPIARERTNEPAKAMRGSIQTGSAQRAPAAGLASAPRGAAEPARAPTAKAEPHHRFAAFADIVARAAAERDIQLKISLERDVRLVRFEDGTLEFSLAPGGSPQLAQTLMRKLQDWTGRRWVVAVSTAAGAPSLKEQADARDRGRAQDVAKHPVVRSIMERFPGAAIVAVRSAQVAADAAADAPAPADSAHELADELAYDDSDPGIDDEF